MQASEIRYVFGSQQRVRTVLYGRQTVHYQYDASGNRTNRIVVTQANPKADYNANGLYDLWELTYFGNLLTDPLADDDHDGANNFAESRAWTDPNDALSSLRVTQLGAQTNEFTLRWEVRPNVSYRVWWADFVNTWDATNSVVNSTGVFTDGITNAQRFYRVSVVE